MGQLSLSDTPPRVLGVVLAAGSGTRMGTPKASLVVAGERLLDRAVDVLRQGACDDVVAVVPVGVFGVEGVRTIENPSAGTGMRSSLELALSVAPGYDGLAVTLVDTPGVGAAAVRATVGHWRAAPARISVAVYNGRRGHPTVMATARWADAVAAAGPDEGARAYLQAHAGEVDEVVVEGDATDLDTPEDVLRWLARDGSTGGPR